MGDKPNAISFPTWSVAIGDKPLAADFNYYVVPNGFCYVNQCLESYLTSATSDKGAGYGKLVSSPNMGKPGSGTCGLATALLTPPPSRTRALSWAATWLCPLARLSLQCAATPRSPWRPRRASAKNVFYITGALAVSSWDGKEWPAPLQTTG